MNEVNRVTKQLDRLKNHKYISIVILIGVILISISTFTDSLAKISGTIKSIFVIESIDESQLELINKQLRPVYFSFLEEGIEAWNPDKRSTTIDSISISKLDEYVIILQNIKGNYVLLIEGYTNRMILESNLIKAKTRVKNVADYLIYKGILSERIKTIAFGGEDCNGDFDEYKERVEFKVLNSK